ncbi:CCHC-type domain-containing protein [Citrus sinensis]|uniref:CCHC-type domain-containing protein n=1 Tax=Citrus sinensis TaxID=2711 RepID=A0ACB8M7X6_CITSI|nr:CCHC-type domain-containing protein [Citrus sinensis]
MDAEELLRKCQASVSKEEETDIVTFMGRMKIKGEEIAANCLVGKVLTSRSINKEGLKAAMQMAWRTVKEVKIESMGDNIFLFASEEEKKRVLMGGPWHFDRALIVLTEPTGIGDIKNQSFTHATFWVQFHNIPIMCMNKEAIQKLGEKIGTVKEVETDDAGECFGQFARARISIDISQPLKKIVFLQQADGKTPMPILYEKLPDFCFCCAHIGHQYRECLRYKGLQKEDLPYGAPTSPSSNNPIDQDGSKLNNSVRETRDGAEPEDTRNLLISDKTHLMLTSSETKNQQVGSQSMGSDINEVHNRVASNDSHYSYESTKAGEKILKKNENPVDKIGWEIPKDKRKQIDESARSDVEEMDSGPSKTNAKPKARKWKLKARIPIAKGAKNHGLIGAKRLSSDDHQLSPQHKKKRVLSPPKQSHVGNHISLAINSDYSNFISSNRTARKLQITEEISDEGDYVAAMEEEVSAGAEFQARRQP